MQLTLLRGFGLDFRGGGEFGVKGLAVDEVDKRRPLRLAKAAGDGVADVGGEALGGSQGVALFEADDGDEIHGGSEMNHMALRLKSGEYEKVKAVLEEQGIEVNGRRGDPRCIYFSDPDGHRLQLLTPGEE